MKSTPRSIALVVTALLAVTVTLPAAAQTIQAPIDTLSVLGRSSWEDGYLSLFDMNRAPVGARMIGMGGAGLALVGGPEYMGLNPVSILGVEQVELEAEAVLEAGGGRVTEFPELIPISEDLFLNSSDYRVSPRSVLDYRSLSLGSPLVIFGKRGAVALTYRRTARAGQSAETRTQLRSNAFQSNEPVTFGRGDNPDGGLDAISMGLARELTSWLDLGAALNFESGTLSRDDESGISTYGFTILHGFTTYDQDVSAVNLDLGAQMDFGRLTLAGTAYLGHDLEFTQGRAKFEPLPGTTISQRYLVGVEIPDHTMSIPTMIGLGAAFKVNDRLTVAADFWKRPWGDVEITRESLDPVAGFSNPADSTSFITELVRGEGEETFNAGLQDDNSFRFGLEYMFIEKPNVSVPVRIGFRNEKKTISNVSIPQAYEQYYALVVTYYQQLGAGAVDPAVEAALLDFVEHNQLLTRGDMVSANVFSFGFGINIDALTMDLALERASYDVENFFLGGFDPDLRFNALPLVDTVSESRSVTSISFTTRWRF